MKYQELSKIRYELIRLQLSSAVGSDIYNKCNEALEITEDLMVNTEFASQEEKLLVFKDLASRVASLSASVFSPLGDK